MIMEQIAVRELKMNNDISRKIQKNKLLNEINEKIFQDCLTRFLGGPIGGICCVTKALNVSAIR